MRIGLHVGEPAREEDDYFGVSVVVARRLCDSAQGGQIIASDLVRALREGSGATEFRPLGALKLKGIAAPVGAFEVLWEPELEAPARTPAALARESVFVGRQKELRDLQAAFEAAASGRSPVCVLTGEPGIGKTALAEQLCAYGASHGGLVLRGHCYEEASLSLPYLPFVEALRSYVRERDAEALKSELGSGAGYLARLVPEVQDKLGVEPSPSGSPEDDRWRLFQSVSDFLCQATQARPMVLLLEDLHWADSGTLALLPHVVSRRRATASATGSPTPSSRNSSTSTSSRPAAGASTNAQPAPSRRTTAPAPTSTPPSSPPTSPIPQSRRTGRGSFAMRSSPPNRQRRSSPGQKRCGSMRSASA